jgi:hypothetical protein
MPQPMPTRADIQTLTRFLPRLYADGFQPVLREGGGTENEDGFIQMPYPVYDALVLEFFQLASQEWWSDTGYDPKKAGKLLVDDEKIKGPLAVPGALAAHLLCPGRAFLRWSLGGDDRARPYSTAVGTARGYRAADARSS